MKLRELRQRSAGEGTVWPPRWVGPSGPGQVPEDGVLEGLERLGNRLLLQITFTGNGARPASNGTRLHTSAKLRP